MSFFPIVAALAAGLQTAVSPVPTDAVPREAHERIVTLLVPPGVSTRRALRDLREADPNGSYDFDHLFVSLQSAPALAAPAPPAAGALAAAVDVRVGLIDGGVDAAHAVFATRPPQVQGCDGAPTASVRASLDQRRPVRPGKGSTGAGTPGAATPRASHRGRRR